MVRHFLKDGTEVQSVAGRVIPVSEFPELNGVIRAINRRTEINKDERMRQNDTP